MLAVDQIDQALSEVQGSVEVASKYLKSRIKYHREVTSYLNKRAQIGTPDYCCYKALNDVHDFFNNKYEYNLIMV